MRLLLNFFLTLVILLGACKQLPAHTYASTKRQLEKACLDAAKQRSPEVIVATSSGHAHQKHNTQEFIFENEEETESISLKKRQATIYYLARTCFSLTSGNVINYAKVHFLSQHCPESASSLYLLIHVLRI